MYQLSGSKNSGLKENCTNILYNRNLFAAQVAKGIEYWNWKYAFYYA